MHRGRKGSSQTLRICPFVGQDQRMSETEHLRVRGVGASREDALKDADAQAAQYFGDAPTIKEIGEARAHSRSYDGSVELWEIDVIWRPRPD
jgi:hypothetical protein